MLNLLAWIVFGALAGWLASKIVSTNKRQSWAANVAVGIVGAIIGGSIWKFLGGGGFTGFNIPSLIVAVLGSIGLLWFIGWLAGPSNRSRRR